jgi:hypothetical protein
VPSVTPPRPAKGHKPAKVGGGYQWVDPGCAVAEAPQALLEVVIEKELLPEELTNSQKAQAFMNASRGAGGSAIRGHGQCAWAEAALENECDILAGTAKGCRNEQLNRSAFKLSQIIDGGGLSESEVIDALMHVADAIGLVKDDGSKACNDTIKSGLKTGKAKPRQPKATEAVDDDHGNNTDAGGAGGGNGAGGVGTGAPVQRLLPPTLALKWWTSTPTCRRTPTSLFRPARCGPPPASTHDCR